MFIVKWYGSSVSEYLGKFKLGRKLFYIIIQLCMATEPVELYVKSVGPPNDDSNYKKKC